MARTPDVGSSLTPARGIDPVAWKRHSAGMPDFIRRIPDGDDRERLVCPDCGHVAYENPKIVVGSVVAHTGRVLLCRRAIEPRQGFWTLPAGYLELGETIEEGARREAWEEARVRIVLEGILGVYSISRIGQVQILFRARFAAAGTPDFGAGPESLEVALFSWDRIPWDRIAFPTVRWALERWQACGAAELGQPASNPAEDPRGTRHIEPRAPVPPPTLQE
jgi:ADP-ribose pyrophosphatase YjhB (NUDIX family)